MVIVGRAGGNYSLNSDGGDNRWTGKTFVRKSCFSTAAAPAQRSLLRHRSSLHRQDDDKKSLLLHRSSVHRGSHRRSCCLLLSVNNEEDNTKESQDFHTERKARWFSYLMSLRSRKKTNYEPTNIIFVSLPALGFADFSAEFLAGSGMQKREIQEKSETQAFIAAICWSFLKIMMHGKKVRFVHSEPVSAIFAQFQKEKTLVAVSLQILEAMVEYHHRLKIDSFSSDPKRSRITC